MTSESRRISSTPPVPGISATSPISLWNVVRSSCAIQAARSSHRHCVHYSISIRGLFGVTTVVQCPQVASLWFQPMERERHCCCCCQKYGKERTKVSKYAELTTILRE